eukprot:TRINITY_DN15855_c0_g1_i1.p1 TRINITY_DN15855_c0_g1~~TRINITY_DN15855_c0_g1_i1.p1  ORF type:complete len:55 (+),score=0.51 TRINITY_DN15855_c0_g1_i1:23-187(+)
MNPQSLRFYPCQIPLLGGRQAKTSTVLNNMYFYLKTSSIPFFVDPFTREISWLV